MDRGSIKAMLEPVIREAKVARVAEASGVPREKIQKWFAGTNRMSDEQIEDICGALGMELRLQPVLRTVRRSPRKREA
jgi:DNA-binding phage protein